MRYFLAAILAVCLPGLASAATTTLFDDDFAPEVAGAVGTVSTLNFTGLTNWTITDGAVDLFTNGGFGLPCGSAGCLDLDGSVTNAVAMQTNVAFSFVTGNTYDLALDLSGRNSSGAESLDFGILGGPSVNYSVAAGAPAAGIQTLSFTALSDFSGAIFLDHAGGDNFGLLLDRVTLTETTPNGIAPVPLPASSLLMVAGFGALALQRRRRRA